MNNVIEIKKLTKDYGSGRGIFDIDLDIARGEMVGFAGTNGSGKTTTIRHIMGFIQPTKGAACVNGLEAWQHSSEYVREIGYVPGEIAFPDLSTGTIFLKSQADFLNLKDLSYAQELIEHLQLDPGALLRRMSKGMKQKTAIVAALMADPAIIILDEPTTGLDPLMRDELETTCDRVALISNGRLVSIADMEKIRHPETRDYKIEFNDGTDYEKFKTLGFEIVRDQPKYQQVTVSLSGDRLNDLFLTLKGMDVRFVSEVKYNLEKYFHEKLGREEEDE